VLTMGNDFYKSMPVTDGFLDTLFQNPRINPEALFHAGNNDCWFM
jgi:hypothetical protein